MCKKVEAEDLCELCYEPLEDGETVLQLVQDRHPTYDREIVLSTFHKECFDGAEELTHECPHCECYMRLTLIRKGKDYQNLSHKLLCPFCAALFDSQMGF